MNANKTSRLISTIQFLVSSFLTILLIAGFILAYTQRGTEGLKLLLGNVFPEIAIILGSFIPVLVLRIKHRSQVAEGYLLPLFLLFLSLQTTRMFPHLLRFSDSNIISYNDITILGRFFFMASYTVLLFASIQNMKNVSTSRTGVNVSFSLVACFIVSYIVPRSSVPFQSGVHETVFNFLVLIILLSAVLTYLVSFLADKETYHLNRFFTFLFISLGDFLIITNQGNQPVLLAGTVLFIIGAVMLSAVSPKGY